MRIVGAFVVFGVYVVYAYAMCDSYTAHMEAAKYYGIAYPIIMWWMNAIVVTGAVASLLWRRS